MRRIIRHCPGLVPQAIGIFDAHTGEFISSIWFEHLDPATAARLKAGEDVPLDDREFCEHCGAHLPPHRRVGEGTCRYCDPQGVIDHLQALIDEEEKP